MPDRSDADALAAAILASSDDAVISRDLTGQIIEWNVGAERMFGYRAAEAVGRPINAHRSRGTPRRRGAPARAGAHRAWHRALPDRAADQGGELIDVTLSAWPVRSETGEIVGVSDGCPGRDPGEAARARSLPPGRDRRIRPTTRSSART